MTDIFVKQEDISDIKFMICAGLGCNYVFRSAASQEWPQQCNAEGEEEFEVEISRTISAQQPGDRK